MSNTTPFDFSLILCTINRTVEVREFLTSLAAQKRKFNIELVVVDQNPDERLFPVLQEFQNLFTIRHLKAAPGLSRARNTGLAEASGRIIGFPDDDCTYGPELLDNLYEAFDKTPECGGISTLVTDKEGNFSAGGRMYRTPCRINSKNVWWCGVSPSIFVRKDALGDLLFDGNLGVGSGTIFGSGEETDFLLNLLERGVRLEYMPQLLVYHPRFNGPWKSDRGWLYGCGMGRVLRKHGTNAVVMFYYAALQQVRAVQAFFTFKYRKMFFHLAMSFGRIRGYFAKI